jgi:hypothetical protein
MCKKIHRGGNAEHYHANKKYKEALAVAVEACAEDAKGQTCYICMEAVHPSTGEGLVRGCACQGDQGFAHVSCLVRQDEVLWADRRHEVEDETISAAAEYEALLSCKLCKRQYNAAVLHALGWGIWKTQANKSLTPSIAGSSDSDSEYTEALSTLALCLAATGREAESREVIDALEIFIEGYEREQQRRIDELEQQRQDLTNRLTKAQEVARARRR